MKLGSLSLASAALFAIVHAGWEDEGDKCPAPQTIVSTVISKEYVEIPTTYYLTSTVKDVQYKTETAYITTTVYDVEYKTDTVTVTITNVQVKQTTVVDTVTNVETQAEYFTETQVRTDVSTVTATVVEVDTTTVTEEGPTVTVTDCPTPEPLTGLVTCPPRIVNPTYTPEKPLPADHHWGCAPGTICTPPQIDCNFEQNPPALSYVCAPEECKPVPGIPDTLESSWPSPTDANCAWYEPPPGYFNLNPEFFGLTFAIFDIYGQPVCEEPSAEWGDWKDLKGKPPRHRRARRTNNPLAYLVHRQAISRAPAECYATFNYANLVGSEAGYRYSQLCADGTPFQNAIQACEECAADAEGGQGTRAFPELQDYLNWCEDNPPSS